MGGEGHIGKFSSNIWSVKRRRELSQTDNLATIFAVNIIDKESFPL